MPTKFDARQIISRDTLQQIASAAGVELDDLLRSIDQDLVAPLRMTATGANRVVSIGSGTVVNTLTNRTKSIPPIGGLLPSFTAGTITFPAASGGTITVSPGNNATLTLASNQYQKFLIYLDATGALNVLGGTASAVEANATVPPSPEDTLAVGYVTVFNNAGTIDNIAQAKVYQFGVGAGGSGGSGDVTSIETVLRARLLDSDMELVTPNIAKSNKSALLDNASTAAYSLISKTFEYSSAGQHITSVQMLDPDEFLDESKDVSVVELVAFWAAGFVDTAATYQVSRNGGINYQTVTMERVGDATNVYRGRLQFADTESNTVLDTYASSNIDNAQTINATTQQAFSQPFTITATKAYKSVDVFLQKTGAISGTLYASLVKDNGSGAPSTAIADTLVTSSLNIGSLATGNVTANFTLPATVLKAGTYHIVLKTDAAYKTQFVNGVTQLSIRTDGSSPGVAALYRYDGTSWSVNTGNAFPYVLYGRALDLRVKITSSAGSKRLDGYGVFYNQSVTGIVTGQKLREVVKFNNQDGANTGGIPETLVASFDQSQDDGTWGLNENDGELVAVKFVPSQSGPISKVTARLQNATGFQVGNVWMEIHADDGTGKPAVASLGASDQKANNTTNFPFATTNVDFDFTNGPNVVAGTTYWLVLNADATFFNANNGGNNYSINWWGDHSAGGYADQFALSFDNGATWGSFDDFRPEHFIYVGGALNSSNEFLLTRFMPDPDTLSVYCVETGQVFKYGAFSLNGNKVIFPEGTFDNGGIETEYTLIFDQTQGASFDNSDQNAALLAANFLGSTNPSIDRSQAGRGIFLRSPNGTLYEITVDNDGNLAVYST